MSRAAPFLLAALCFSTAAARADDLRIQCPAGTYAVLESETTVLCKRKPTQLIQPPPQPVPTVPSTVVITRPAPETPPAQNSGMELVGLQSVPETCGLEAVDFDVGEKAAEAVYLAVSGCVEDNEVNPPMKPARWLAVPVSPTERGHLVNFPNEPWAGTLQGCLLRKPPRLPKAMKGRSFMAYYLLTSNPKDRPPPPACLAGRVRGSP